MTNVVAIGASTPPAIRAAAAKRIRQLMEDWTNNTLEMGAELDRVRETFPIKGLNHRPGWEAWLESEIGIGRRHAYSLIVISRQFRDRRALPKNMGVQVLSILAQKSMPKEAREEVIARIESGETIGRRDVKEIANKHRLPGPKTANEQARETGTPVLASDGYIYFGASPEQAKEGEDRRTMVFGVRRALTHLASIELTGTQFLKYALPHHLWSQEEAKVIKQALRWLKSLDEAWDKWDAR